MASLQLQTEQFFKQVAVELKKEIPEKLNPFAYPDLKSITLNVGVGKYDNKQKSSIAEYLTKLTAQKPKMVKTNKSISGFNLRAGNVVGITLTLRGKKMHDFLINLIYASLPRTRDFKGVKNSFDKTGKTLSMGIASATIFPAVGFDPEVDFGMQINLVFKNNSIYNHLYLEKINFPFIK